MNKVKPFYPLFKVGIELQKPGAEGYFTGLKFVCQCEGCNTPFEFLNKLINTIKIDVDENPHDYTFLIKGVREYSFNSGTPYSYQTIGRNILNYLGDTSGIPTVEPIHFTDLVDKKMEIEAGVKSSKLECSVVFAKFDIDHLCGMSWPSYLYKKFRVNTGNIFLEELPEIDTSQIATVEDCNSELLPTLLSANCETIIIVICGFSPCHDYESTVSSFILPSQSHRVANVVYNLKNLYGLIDTHPDLARKRTIIVLLTLPSKHMNYEEYNFTNQEEIHRYYLPVNSFILASSVAQIRKLRRIVTSEKYLREFYDGLLEHKALEFFDNRLDKKLIFLEKNVRKVEFGKGIFCILNLEGSRQEHFDKQIEEIIVKGRGWIFNDDTILELDNRRESYPSKIEDFLISLKRHIKNNNIDCIIVLILHEYWHSKRESIDVYSSILRTLSVQMLNSYDLPTVCIIQDYLTCDVKVNGLPNTEEFRYTKQDTKIFEDIIATNSKLYFVLPYADYGIDLFNELGEPHSRSLRDLDLKIKTDKRQFSEVICKSEEMDFIFPAPKIPRIDT